MAVTQGVGQTRFMTVRQLSPDPTPCGRPDGLSAYQQLAVLENPDATKCLLFAVCQGEAAAVEELLRSGLDVSSIDLDGHTVLRIAACEGQEEVTHMLLDWKANMNARIDAIGASALPRSLNWWSLLALMCFCFIDSTDMHTRCSMKGHNGDKLSSRGRSSTKHNSGHSTWSLN